jgi:hypothetical protein
MHFPFDEEAREGLPLMIKRVLRGVKLQGFAHHDLTLGLVKLLAVT